MHSFLSDFMQASRSRPHFLRLTFPPVPQLTPGLQADLEPSRSILTLPSGIMSTTLVPSLTIASKHSEEARDRRVVLNRKRRLRVCISATRSTGDGSDRWMDSSSISTQSCPSRRMNLTRTLTLSAIPATGLSSFAWVGAATYRHII